MQVANYIFGNNIAKGSEETSEKVAMTSPVSSEEDFRSMKGGSGEKIAMTSPVATDMDGAKYDSTSGICISDIVVRGEDP